MHTISSHLIARYTLGITAIVGASIALADLAIGYLGRGDHYDATTAPPSRVAIALGASVAGGVPGSYVRGRLDATLMLVTSGKVGQVFVTGNSRGKSGDEIAVMSTWLIDHGVLPEQIVTDDVGLDTYASCVHARKQFGSAPMLIVTQNFHLTRALAIARRMGLNAKGVVAEADSTLWSLARNWVRELVASRPKAVTNLTARRS